MRSIIRSSYAAAPLLLGSTLVYALPRNGDRLIPRAFSFDGITAVTGSIPQPTPSQTTPAPTPTVEAAAVSSTSDTPAQAGVTNIPSQSSDTTNTWSITTTSGVLSNTNTWSITTTSGSLSNPAFSILNAPSSSTTATHGSLAPPPAVDTSQGVTGHGVLTGVVAGGLVIGLLCLTVGLWFCYRRRGPTSGASTPKYATKVVADDEKPRSAAFAFLRGGSLPWKKSHIRVRSSMSFASPILENEPKMVESNHSSVRSPLAPHLSGSTGTRADWNSNGRWSTFSTSDSSAYPQTPVGGHLSGIIMETVVETDAASDPRTPTMTPRQNIDYLDMKRSSNEPMLPALTTTFHTRPSPPGSNRLSDDASTPTTYSSGGRTFGSVGHGSSHPRTSDGLTQPPMLPTHFDNGSKSKFLAQNSSALLASKPRFDPTVRHNGSDTVSIDRESGETIKITNPFLDDDDGISSYGHGVMIEDADDGRRSIRTMDSDAHGAYPSSTGCLDPKVSPSPSPDAPITRPRSSLISDTSSDYPYPLGYAIDSDGNVANPFLRISELLEEVDGRMRWPSPPLLPRTESRNY